MIFAIYVAPKQIFLQELQSGIENEQFHEEKKFRKMRAFKMTRVSVGVQKKKTFLFCCKMAM